MLIFDSYAIIKVSMQSSSLMQSPPPPDIILSKILVQQWERVADNN